MGEVIPFAPRGKKNCAAAWAKDLDSYRYFRIVIKESRCQDSGNRIIIRIEMLNERNSEIECEFLNELENGLRRVLPNGCGVEFPEREDDCRIVSFQVFGDMLTRIVEIVIPVLRKAGLTAQNTEIVSFLNSFVPND